jgi:hypothetical protein
MRWTCLLVVAWCVIVSEQASSVAGEPPAREAFLIGKWKSRTGDMALELRADRVVFLEAPTAPADGNGKRNGTGVKPAEKPTADNGTNGNLKEATNGAGQLETRQGVFTVRRGVWTLTVRDIHQTSQHFSIVSYDANVLGLFDAKGTRTFFDRVK